MNTIPKLMLAQVAAIYPHVDPRDHQYLMTIENGLIDKANAEQSAQQESEYITAEQARELGAGKAECLFWDGWQACDGTYYPPNHRYRAIKAQPEPVVAFCRPYDPKTQVKKIVEPVEPTTIINGERMTLSAAEALKVGLGDSVEWFDWSPMRSQTKSMGEWFFSSEDFYAHSPKATIKLDGKMVTPEQAVAEWGSKKETHDVWVNQMLYVREDSPRFTDTEATYELRPRQPKIVKWADMPVGVMTNEGEFQGCHMWGNKLQISVLKKATHNERKQINSHDAANVKLAPASKQKKYIVGDANQIRKIENSGLEFSWRDCDKGFGDGIIIFKITGIAKGYVMEGAA